MAESVAKYQQYEEYKDSGVIWLKDLLPKAWTLSRIKYLCYVNDGNHGEEYPKESDYTDSQNGVPFIRGGNLSNYAITDEGMLYITHIKNNSMRKGRLKKGDILFVNRGEIGKLALVTEKHTGSNLNSQIAYLRVSNDKILSKYLLYYLDSSYVSNFLVSMKMGSVLTQFPIGDLLDIYVPLPIVKEQVQIANFLDHETAKIDTLIEKQQTLIQLLKEKRQAVISHAVTKGLNPDAPMKDSGVEWLGEVPEHWEVKGIKRLSEIKRGASPRPIADQKYFNDEGEYAWTRIADVSRAGMYLDTTTQRLSDLGASLSVKLEAGELFLSIAGTVGKPCITISKACIHDGFVYFPTLKINNKFLFYIFEAGQAYLGLGKMGTQLNLNTETVGGIEIGLPPEEEIEAIINYIENEKARFDHLIDKAQKAIQLMQERRTALISAAVTGKIDVRGWRASE